MGSESWLRQIITTNQLTLQQQRLAGGTSGKGFQDQSVGTTTVDRYTTDYFAGNQVSIWMGDTWLDDITMIQYHMQQNKRPFWGYKSQRWSTVATGTQIVDGVFSLNFTHTNYLNMVVAEYLRKQQNPLNSSDTTFNVNDIQKFINDARANPSLYQNLSYPVSGNPIGPGSQYNGKFNAAGFNDKAALLESYLWGAPSNNLSTNEVINPDNLPGFDIVINCGNYPQDRVGGGPDENISSHTVKIINDVRILSHSIQAAVTGEPVQEVYTFIARGIDTPLTRNALQIFKSANEDIPTSNQNTAHGSSVTN
jgi:hypothetical protein